MRQFAKKLISEWRKLKLPTTEKTVVAAVSGGADSASLLAGLYELQTVKKLNLKIIVAHFNHKLRPNESDADAAFVKDLAKKFDLNFVCGNPVSDLRNQKSNLEQAARRARYDFLDETAEKFEAFAVLTAHTLDDQAETFMLRLIRGSGADGLAAMQPIRFLKSKIQNPKSKIQLVRPFLSWARRQMTENYCREINLNFRSDLMNNDESFDRVRVRKQLIPLLKTFNPQIVETISKTANLLGEEAKELNAQAENILRDARIENTDFPPLHFALCALRLSKINSVLRRRVLRLWLEGARGNLRRIDSKHLRAIETLITLKEGGRLIELPDGGIVTRRDHMLIYARKVEKTTLDI
ncbi:MAG: tRNA lysidine(34) synthetase TilS [Pyrinomonadaceae bacterium]